MHLVVPFASVRSPAGRAEMASLRDTGLGRWLRGCQAGVPDIADPNSFSPPHQRALARELGWRSEPDRGLPFAALDAWRAGLVADPAPGPAVDLPTRQAAAPAFGRLTPVHLQVSNDGLVVTDPDQLRLTATDRAEIATILRPLIEGDGFALHLIGGETLLISHPLLDDLRCAALDRVVGRSVQAWTADQPSALGRLMIKIQMLLHQHPFNGQRDAGGLAPVNSMWLSDCGRLPPSTREVLVTVDRRLVRPALAGDWAAWLAAWRALDAEWTGRQALRTLTLAGEAGVQRFDLRAAGWRSALAGLRRGPDLVTVLEKL
jgi:hypothetical protein